MKRRVSILKILFSALPALAAASLGLYLYSRDGVPGLLRWVPDYRKYFVFIAVAGILPPALFLVSAVFSRKGKRIASRCVAVPAFIVSVAATALSIGGLFELYRLIHTVPSGLPQLNHYNSESGKPLIRLAFSSDPHIGSPNANAETTGTILATVNTGGYDAFFVLGDIAETGVPGNGFETAAALFAETLTETPLVTLMGNHDALIGGDWRYRKFFNPDLHFRLDSGSVHVIALNLLWGIESFDKAQREWLKKTLTSIPESDTTIVISHCFVRASGYRDAVTGIDWSDNPDLVAKLAPILEEGGVDLVVSGHNHFMEYLEAPAKDGGKGTAYAVIGSMGGIADPERTIVSEYSRWYRGKQPGFLDLDLYDGRMKLTFRDETGKQLHTVTR